MAIIGLQHIGIAVDDFHASIQQFKQALGLNARDFRDDQGQGMQYDARILLGNDCWIHVVENWNPESRVNQFLQRHGPGLEHIALLSDDIEADVARVRAAGVPIFQDKIFDAPDGFEAFIYPEDGIGFTVELIQPHESSWQYPADGHANALSDTLGIIRLQHFGIGVSDWKAACERFELLFGLPYRDFRDDQGQGMQYDARILLGNECWLHVVENWNPESRVNQFVAKNGQQLEHIALQTTTIEDDVAHLKAHNIPLFQDKTFDAADGFEAFIYPEDGVGFTVELIQPHAHSWTYPHD